MVTVAVDTRQRIEQALDEVSALASRGLVTLERARLLTGQLDQVRLPEGLAEATKLTVYLGRHQRATGGRPAFLEVVDLLHRHGVDGATVLLGVDGTAHGVRQRARFFGRNTEVPLMIIAVGAGQAIAGALPELGALLERPLLTLERIRVLKRDGRRLAEPERLPDADPGGLGIWQKLTVYAGEEAEHAGHPHPRWFQIVDELTDQTGLVTCEMVPAFRAGDRRGGLRLSTLPAGHAGGRAR
jgi:PII-like signaling protein